MSDRVCAGPGVTEVGTDGPADCTETLPRVPESARDARLLVCRALDAWGLSALRDSAVLVMSELVANAVDHACGPVVRLSVARTAERRVRVTVADLDRRPPRAGNADPLDERGRGLLLVAALSQRWGVERSLSGKKVWADLAAP